MAIAINGSGTVTGISVGGLPDGIVDSGTLATNSVDSAELIDGAVDTSHFSTGARIVGNTYMWTTTKNLADSGGTTIALSGAGFTPKMAICFANVANTDQNSFGMATSTPTLDYCLSHVATGAYTNQYTRLVGIIPAASNDGWFDVTTWGADGITITYTKGGSPTGTARLIITVVG